MKKIIIVACLFLFSASVALAVTLPPQLVARLNGRVTEKVESTDYVKNSNGTFSKVEKITRTTIIDTNELERQKQAYQDQADAIQQQQDALRAVN